MGDSKREGECNELERLLGEIPNATSGNSHFEEFGRLQGIQHSNVKNAQVNGLNDRSSLATAFGQLNLNNSSAEHVATNKGFDSSVLGGCQYPKNLMLHNLNMNPRFRRTQNSDAFSTRNQIAALPMVNAAQFPPMTALEIPVTNHQPHFMNPLSLVPCFHPPQMENSQVAWRNLDQENYYRLCQQNLYRENIASKMVNQNGVPQYYEMPISQGVQQSVQGQTYNSLFPRCFKQYNLELPSVDRTSQNYVSEKNLSRPNGLNSLRSMKLGAANGQIRYNKSNPLMNRYKEDTHNLLDFSQNGTLINNFESGLLPWKYSRAIDANNSTLLMAKDQHGCRLLQKRISEGDVKEVEKVYGEIVDHIVNLMTDPFGNYLVQKLLEVCSEDQQTRILQMIIKNSGDLIDISCDMHGTRVVQKVIETLRTPEQNFIMINSLKPCIRILMKNTNGNHVVQRCLQYLMPEYSQFIFDAASAYCVDLAMDRHGCCVLQKCLSYCGGKQRRRLIHEISSNALILSQDQFGNYVVQFLFQLQDPQATLNILNQLKGNFANLSMQKYSSNVVEKCLEHAEERRVHIIQELIDNARLDQIMQDPYGNYVIQAALTHAKGAIKSKLLDVIEAHSHILRTSPYGKKVLSCNSLKK